MTQFLKKFSTNGLILSALGALITAGLTGFLIRYQWSTLTIIYNTTYLRHAHSHLMMFGWATVALFISLMIQLKLRVPYVSLLFVALASWSVYPAFLLSGYDALPIGRAKIPVSVILSTLNMILWYYPAYKLFGSIKGEGKRSSGFLTIAIFFLIVSTMGAWGLVILKISGFVISETVRDFSVNFFLVSFTEGWLIPGTLALVITRANIENLTSKRLIRYSSIFYFFSTLILASVGHDLLSCNNHNVSFIVSRSGFFLQGASLILVASLTMSGKALPLIVRMGLTFLMLRGFLAAIAGMYSLCNVSDFRIFYIHLGLLGFVTPVLFQTVISIKRVQIDKPMIFAIILTIGGILMASPGILPDRWFMAGQAFAAFTSLLPLIVAFRAFWIITKGEH